MDGPSGPAKVVKPGIVDMARQAQVPIVPYQAIADRYWSFRSWDRFRLPKPFARIHVRYGTPEFVAAETQDAAFSALQARVGTALEHLEAEHERARVSLGAAARRRPRPAVGK